MSVKNVYKLNCKKCGKEYEVECTEKHFIKGKYKKYCCRSCANSRSVSSLTKKRISDGVIKAINDREITYVCEKCGKEFTSNRIFRNGRKIHCDNCIQKRPHTNKNVETILSLSKRTISKILKRSNKGCAICGWNESSCDIHHIIPQKDNGSNDIENLIIVCPNCHRIIHAEKKYSIEYLKTLSIDKYFPEWKEYYHPFN